MKIPVIKGPYLFAQTISEAAMDDKTKVYIYIDSLGWQTAEENGFAKDILPCRNRVRSVLGSDGAVFASVASGKMPAELGVFYPYIQASGKGPFHAFRYLKFLFGAGLHPKCLFNTAFARNAISGFLRRRKGYSADFSIGNIPYEKLWRLDYEGCADPSAPRALMPARNLRDLLDAAGRPYYMDTSSSPDDFKLDLLKGVILSGKNSFVFVRLKGLSPILMEQDSVALSDRLGLYERSISELVKILEKSGKPHSVSVLSGGGTAPCAKTIALLRLLDIAGLKRNGGCMFFAHPSMLRLWYEGETAAVAAREGLSKLSDFGSILSREERACFGADGPSRIFGDDIFLLKPGVQITPNYISSRSFKAVGGYSPDDASSYAAFLSSERPPFQPDKITDFFKLMVPPSSEA